MADAILVRLKQLIRHRMSHYSGAASLDEDTSFFEQGLGLDSFGTIELVSITEEHFAIQFEEGDLTMEQFANPRALADLLRRRGAK